MKHCTLDRAFPARASLAHALVTLIFLLALPGCGNRPAVVPTAMVAPRPTASIVPSPALMPTASPVPTAGLDQTGHIAFLFNIFEFGMRERIKIIELSDLSIRSLAVNCYICDAISWMPDGNSIVYSGTVSPPDDHSEIFVVEVASGAIRQITRSPELKYGIALSPDGQHAVITVAQPPLKEPDLGILDLTNARVQWLAKTPGYEYNPAWSPDGRSIAYTYNTEAGNDWYVWIMGADGGNAKQVSSLPVGGQVAWSPDSAMLAVSSPLSCGAIWLIDVKRHEANQLTNMDGCASIPVWSPDGRALAFLNTVYVDPIRRTDVKEWAIDLISLDGASVLPLTSGKGNGIPVSIAWSGK